ncbi:hypothetical protein [Eisenbergiella sp.]
MKKGILAGVGTAAALLLLGSFAVRSAAGTLACDVMRGVGFVLLILFVALKFIWKKE